MTAAVETGTKQTFLRLGAIAIVQPVSSVSLEGSLGFV
jgi:hypothetical protein